MTIFFGVHLNTSVSGLPFLAVDFFYSNSRHKYKHTYIHIHTHIYDYQHFSLSLENFYLQIEFVRLLRHSRPHRPSCMSVWPSVRSFNVVYTSVVCWVVEKLKTTTTQTSNSVHKPNQKKQKLRMNVLEIFRRLVAFGICVSLSLYVNVYECVCECHLCHLLCELVSNLIVSLSNLPPQKKDHALEENCFYIHNFFYCTRERIKPGQSKRKKIQRTKQFLSGKCYEIKIKLKGEFL